MSMNDAVVAVIRLVGGPYDGRRAGVSESQKEVRFSDEVRPVYYVYRVDHVLFRGVYVGVRDVKLMRVDR